MKCLDCRIEIALGLRCGRCVAVRVAGDLEDAAVIDARFLAARARRIYESRRGRGQHVDGWEQRTEARAPRLTIGTATWK